MPIRALVARARKQPIAVGEQERRRTSAWPRRQRGTATDVAMRLPLGRATLVARAETILFAAVGMRERLTAGAEILGGLGLGSFYYVPAPSEASAAKHAAVVARAAAEYRRELLRGVWATEEALAAGATREQLAAIADELSRLLWQRLPRRVSGNLRGEAAELEWDELLDGLRALRERLRDAPRADDSVRG